MRVTILPKVLRLFQMRHWLHKLKSTWEQALLGIDGPFRVITVRRQLWHIALLSLIELLSLSTSIPNKSHTTLFVPAFFFNQISILSARARVSGYQSLCNRRSLVHQQSTRAPLCNQIPVYLGYFGILILRYWKNALCTTNSVKNLIIVPCIHIPFSTVVYLSLHETILHHQMLLKERCFFFFYLIIVLYHFYVYESI